VPDEKRIGTPPLFFPFLSLFLSRDDFAAMIGRPSPFSGGNLQERYVIKGLSPLLCPFSFRRVGMKERRKRGAFPLSLPSESELKVGEEGEVFLPNRE